MHEARDLEEAQDSEIEPGSNSVSFPDHYLVPYILMCKRSKRITCAWSIILIGLAIYFFFATSYKILFNYPITVSRKIACVFGGVICLVAAARCLELRFKIIQECRGERDETVLFEIAPRDTEFSDSFTGHFEMQEMPLCHGTPIEGLSQTEATEDSISRAHTIDDPCFPDTSTIHYNGGSRLPRHSISDGLAPDTPLLPQRKSLEPSRLSGMKSWLKSLRLQKDGTVSDNNKCPSNCSTFDNGCEESDTKLLLSKSALRNGCEASETESLLYESTFRNGCDVSDTDPLLAELTFRNGCDAPETEPLLAETTFQDGFNTNGKLGHCCQKSQEYF